MHDAPAADPFLLFVYGTLKRGGGRHRLLADQRLVGGARTRPLYALHNMGEYPALVRRGAGGRSVAGELYEVAAALVPALDAEEGAPTLFRLAPVELDGRDGPVFAYLYQRSVEGAARCGGDRWDGPEGR